MAELSASEHVGMHRYTFPKSAEAHILIDLNHSIDKSRNWYPCRISAQATIVNDQTVEGYRIITGWGEGYRKVYFRAEFSKHFRASTLVNENGKYNNLAVINGHSVKALLDFDTDSNEVIVVKVGLSATSQENACLNLQTEVPGWDFDKVRRHASDTWEKELEKISVQGTPEQKQIFYTAMYHAFIQPNNIADVNGDFPAPDMTTRHADDLRQYSTFSLWDTYRAANPLYTLVQTKRTAGIVNSLLRQYDVQGYLPIWQLWGLENYCMIGNHAIPVIVDAALKGVGGFDVEHAYEAVKNSSMRDHLNSPFSVWEKYAYMPEDVQSQSVSITLEMAFDDWCVAQLAKKLGKTNDYDRFLRRSFFYKNLYDEKTGFFRAKNKDGRWIEPFNPLKYSGNGDGPFTEGNAWQYLFYVPQDMSGLVALMGGKDALSARLDTFFTLNDQTSEKNGNASGFIGQYAHGNEPSHHAAYLYNFSGQPWKTQKYVSQILKTLYNDNSAGYAGNEDCGQMSAWYVFSAMGFYPFNPVSGIYTIGSPIVKSAKMHLQNGKTFTVMVENASGENCYIQSLKLDGRPYARTYITQADIMNGSTLQFVMGNQPNTDWGTGLGEVAALLGNNDGKPPKGKR
jgi:predicted alpha-1,2-mannosidase